MNVKSTEKKEHSVVELVIEVSAGEFDAAVEKAYRKNKGRINVPGFRKGKAPRKIIEGMYGSSIFYEDAVEEVYPAAYEDAVKEQGLEVVAYPSVEIVSVGKEGLTFKAAVTVKPEVKLGEYKGLTAPKSEAAVTDEDVEREMAPLVERATRLVTVERQAALGDTVLLDFEGSVDGAPFEGGKGTDYELELGSHTFVPGFEDGLVGVKAGEEKDVGVTFPKEYAPELAGKDAVFHVSVKEVKEKSVPELDDEFAKDVSEFETLDELKKDLGDKLRQRREQDADRAYESALMEQVCDNMEVDVPEAMIDYRVEEMMRDFAQRIAGQGIPFDKYLEYMHTDRNAMKAQMRPGAVANIKRNLALEAIAAAESLSVTEEEVEEEFKQNAQEYKIEVERLKELVNLDDLKKELAMRKAVRLVVDSGKVGEAPKKAEEQPDAAQDEPKKKPAAKKKAVKKAEEAAAPEEETKESAESGIPEE